MTLGKGRGYPESSLEQVVSTWDEQLAFEG